jgi:hypothetical protein
MMLAVVVVVVVAAAVAVVDLLLRPHDPRAHVNGLGRTCTLVL